MSEIDLNIMSERELTIVVNVTNKTVMDNIYENHLAGRGKAMRLYGYHVTAIADGDRIRNKDEEE